MEETEAARQQQLFVGGGSPERRDQEGGSEHSVAGRYFPAEVQLLGYNAELFANLSEAMGRPHGVVGVAVMVQHHRREVNPALRTLAGHLKKVRGPYREDSRFSERSEVRSKTNESIY